LIPWLLLVVGFGLLMLATNGGRQNEALVFVSVAVMIVPFLVLLWWLIQRGSPSENSYGPPPTR
jgi:uncharacterized membrane protein YhaH (DUF805 family)